MCQARWVPGRDKCLTKEHKVIISSVLTIKKSAVLDSPGCEFRRAPEQLFRKWKWCLSDRLPAEPESAANCVSQRPVPSCHSPLPRLPRLQLMLWPQGRGKGQRWFMAGKSSNTDNLKNGCWQSSMKSRLEKHEAINKIKSEFTANMCKPLARLRKEKTHK